MSKKIVWLIVSQFAVKTLATGLALLLQLYLAFILGEDGFGKYALFINGHKKP
ncbi:MAG: hypothetical protein ABFS56_03825 [Pseudomonadota bacterium]